MFLEQFASASFNAIAKALSLLIWLRAEVGGRMLPKDCLGGGVGCMVGDHQSLTGSVRRQPR
jgi:hypothetical protein